jgi:hypothetical protein
MKLFLIAFLTAGPAFLTSCSDNKSSTSTDTTDTVTNTSTATSNPSATQSTADTSQYAGIPQNARSGFESRYPEASNVKWTHFQPGPPNADDWTSDWTSGLDTSDYQVNFNWQGDDYTAWYDNGEWIGSSARLTDNSKLPKAVNDAIHTDYADYTIKDVEKQNDKNQTVYEVDLRKGSDKMKIHYDGNGKALKTKGKVNGTKTKTKEKAK